MIRHCLRALLLLSGSAAATAAQSMAPVGDPIGRWLQPSRAPVSSEARIFLVAGSRDIANFAQEIVDQRKLWLARGYAENQIECFYAAPSPTHRIDVPQFLALEQDLAACHLASPRAVFDAIGQVAANYPADHFYLYVTSHGTPPALTWPEAVQKQIDPEASWLPAALEQARTDPASGAFEWFSPFRIEMEGFSLEPQGGWGWATFVGRYRDMHMKSGASAADNLFTPRLLAAALRQFPPGVRRIVVLQACYSGGFLLPPEQAPTPEETLTTLEHVTVLTASRADRTSFGCDSGAENTYYGRSLQKVLEGMPGRRIPDLDWRTLHERMTGEVERLEKEQQISGNRRSLPQYFAN